ncbi:MAG: DUF86 domain-containing protein [Gammaproteobacteria bacterium]|nr:DUF86 domain-containing protein [Gammaproteobacteria bacterium]MXW45756.1 DUF86 domain-containing protein [Gammaproteobacteria bacterium]MYD03120.1 DUF86 domain-containing protein [Gammaproteobacteria bacterium]MYI25743.1 DUF86 domain-containing protein [Gammaproteobacteria bacterium]
MSDGKRTQREWRLYAVDMIEFCERVLSYTRGLDQQTFIADRRTYDATLRNLELIGEAGSHVPLKVREAYPAIPWREIIALRNRLIHAYLGIDDDVLWDIIRTDVPPLLSELQVLNRQEGS